MVVSFTTSILDLKNLPAYMIVFSCFFMTIWFTSGNMGVATTPDSASYISTANSLRHQFSLEEYRGAALSLYPPMYSAILASTALVTFRDVRFGAPRLVAAAFFGLFGLLTFVVLKSTSGHFGYGILGCSAVLSCRALVEVGTYALSEVPFMVFSIGGAILLHQWSINRRPTILVCSAFLFAFASMTRYVGIVWPAATLVLLLADSAESSVKVRFRSALLFGIVVFTPFLIWTIGWSIESQKIGQGSLLWHPVQFDQINMAFSEVGQGIGLQTGFSGWILFALALILAAGQIYRANKLKTFESRSEPRLGFHPITLLTIFSLAYLIFVAISISIFNRATPMDWRIMTPATWMFIVLFILLLRKVVDSNRPAQNIVLTIISIFFFTRFLYEVTPQISDWSREGHGLSHYSIQNDPTLSWIRNDVGDDVTIFSNVPWIVYLTSNRNAKGLPNKESYTTGRVNLNYRRELLDVMDFMARYDGLILMDKNFNDPMLLTPSIEEIELLGLKLVEGLDSERFVVYRN